MSLIFLLDYVPVLTRSKEVNKASIVLYYYLDQLKDDNGNVKATYADIHDHLRLSKNIISKSFAALKGLGLIEKKEEASRGNHYKVLPIKSIFALEAEQAKEYAEQKLQVDVEKLKHSHLRQQYVDIVPAEYLHTIFDIEKMREAYKKLGSSGIRTVKQIAKHFDLDFNQLKAYMDIPSFKQRVLQQIKEIDPKKKDVVAVVRKRSQKTGTEVVQQKQSVYDGLMKVHLDKKSQQPKPIEQWKSAELLRYFCIQYEKVIGDRYIFQDSKVFSGRDIKHVKSILGNLKNQPIKVVEFIDWVFRYKCRQVDSVTLGLLQSSRMLNEFLKYQSQQSKVKTNGNVDSEFTRWVDNNLSDTFRAAGYYKTYRGLQMLAQEYDDEGNNCDSELSKCIEEARKRNIIN